MGGWETSIVQRDGHIDVYLKTGKWCVTIGGMSPEPYFTTHRSPESDLHNGDLPLVTIADPELIPEAVAALRSLLGALEAM